ncbi:MAG: hypothetical protein WC705_02045 [Candidatus Paceibacterota bacterium]|jgi:hypothetical protein
MSRLIEKIKNWIKFQKESRKILMVYFLGDGVFILKLIYHPAQKTVTKTGEFFLYDVSESNFSKNLKYRAIVLTSFFPFPYYIIVGVSQNYGWSKYTTIVGKKISKKENLDNGDIGTVFSEELWKILELNKKEAIKKMEIDEANLLLAGNSFVNIKTDKNKYSIYQNSFPEDIGGHYSDLGLCQTFIDRKIFNDLEKIIPSRAKISSFFEKDFYFPLHFYLQESQKKDKCSDKFAVILIKEKESKIILWDKISMFDYDKINFGVRNVYQSINYLLGMDRDSFVELINKMDKSDLSDPVKKIFENIFVKELGNLRNGIASLKTSLKIKNIYIEGGILTPILRLDKRIANLLISPEIDEKIINMPSDIPAKMQADILANLILSKSVKFFEPLLKMTKWLIPHQMKVVK